MAILLLLGGVERVAAQSKKSTKKYTLAYFEAGDYPFHRALQRELRDKLEKLAPDEFTIEFSPAAYKSAEWNREACKRMAREITANRSIDLVLAMGPWTVEDLLEAGFKKPIVAMGRFDPTLEGLAGADGRPKYKNLTVRLRPAKVETDLSVLQAVYPAAEKIGIMYFPSANESAVVEGFFKQKAERLGLKVTAVPPDPAEVNYLFFKKIEKLRGRVDAVYLTPLYGMTLSQINSFFGEMERAGLPVFGSEGFYQLERGAFATNASHVAAGVSRFHADKIIKILQGARPSSLPTVFREGRRLAINLDACDKAGIRPAPNLIAEARLIERTPDPSVQLYTVSSAISEARRANPGLLANYDAFSAARSKAGAGKSALYPHLSAKAYLNSYDANPPENALRVRTQGKSGFELNLTQTLFDLREFRASALAGAEFSLSEIAHEDFARQFEFAVAAEFMALHAALERSAVISTGREDAQRALQIGLSGYLLGEVDRNDLLRWESRKDQWSVEVSRARAEIERLRIKFLSLLGRTESEPFAIDQSLYSSGNYEWKFQRPEYLRDPVGRDRAAEFWLREALGASSKIKNARSQLSAARAKLSAQSGALMPRVEGFATYFKDNQYAISSPLAEDEQGFLIGARISASLFNGGRDLKEKARLKSEVSRFEYLVDQALVETSAEVRSAHAAFLAAFDRTQFAKRRMQLVAETLEGMFAQYELGRLSLAEMAGELRQTVQARLDMIDAVQEFHSAKHALYASAGVGYLAPRGTEEVALFERIAAFLLAR